MTPPRAYAVYSTLAGGICVAVAVGLLTPVLGESFWLVLSVCAGLWLALIVFFSPRVGFYVLVASAMFNRYEIPVGPVQFRADQLVLLPVMLGLSLRLIRVWLKPQYLHKSYLRSSKVSVAVLVGLALYILLNALSSLLFSPDFMESFKIIVWLSLSFAALLAAYFVVGRYVSVQEALLVVLAAGFVSAAVGVLLFAFSTTTGAAISVQEDPVTHYTLATGTFFEANIFGSFQAFSAAAGLALLTAGGMRRGARVWLALGSTVSAIALALSFTRAAWLGFLAGLLIIFLFQIQNGRLLTRSLRALALVLFALGVLAPTGLLAHLADRFASINDVGSGTIAYRFVRFEAALADWKSSPILGLGTNSFGQRHLGLTSEGYVPDHLASIFLTTLYDVGVAGLLVLLTVFGVVVGALFRVVWSSSKARQRSRALALLCGIIGLLIAYQATNAWWYSYNWIILAIAIRFYEANRSATKVRYPSGAVSPRSVRSASQGQRIPGRK
jgi:O-antigen ligase